VSTRNKGLIRSAVAVLVTAGLVLLPLTGAVADPNPVGSTPSGQGSGSTELTIGAIRNQGSVNGGFNTSVTATTPYPGTQANASTETTAQIVLVDINDPNGPVQGVAYCIDLRTDTTVGVNYKLGDWTTANVPNLPYVNFILTNYFPNNPAAPTLASDAQRVQAVQAAIWYFTDQFVLSTNFSSTIRQATAAIILAAQQNGGNPPPPTPTLTITPSTAQVPDTGDIVGPFTVGGTVTTSTLTTRGVDVFTDAAGTHQLSDGDPVASGQQLWIRYASAVNLEGFELGTTQTVTGGNVYLYDNSNPGRTAAQKLILATTTTLPIRANVAATVQEAGSLQVTKTVAGAGAGLQGAISINIACSNDGPVTNYPLTIPSGAKGDVQLPLISGIPAGSTCTITEPDNGANSKASLTSTTITPETVTMADLDTAASTITNTYAAVTPTPTPTPAVHAAALAATGSDPYPALWGALLLLGFGVVLICARVARRQH
jgi:hypothetical protein